MSRCEAPGCASDACTRNLCSAHYQRMRRNGTTTSVVDQTPMEKFKARVDYSAGTDGCMEWTGPRSKQGYGIFYADGKYQKATRWILGRLRGRVLDDDEHALHRCDNPPCVNPLHLYVGSPSQNMQDRLARGRDKNASKTHCAQGHPYDDDNTYRRPDGARACKTCVRANVIRYRAKRRAKAA